MARSRIIPRQADRLAERTRRSQPDTAVHTTHQLPKSARIPSLWQHGAGARHRRRLLRCHPPRRRLRRTGYSGCIRQGRPRSALHDGEPNRNERLCHQRPRPRRRARHGQLHARGGQRSAALRNRPLRRVRPRNRKVHLRQRRTRRPASRACRRNIRAAPVDRRHRAGHHTRAGV